MAGIEVTEAAYSSSVIQGDFDLDSYQVTLKDIDSTDRDRLHQMTVGVGWPHRARDLDLIIALGRGLIGLDQIGRPICTAMSFPWGDDFATIGMMTTTPRLQAQGAGRWLLQRMMEDCGSRGLRLLGTRAGHTLYLEAGFIPMGPVRQMQGIAACVDMPDPVPGLTVRPVVQGDIEALLKLDTHAFGASRVDMLGLLLARGDGLIALRNDLPVGFALRRKFGRGTMIGPVVAEDDDVAMHLIAPLIGQLQGSFARMDTPVDSPRLLNFLKAAGMSHFDSVTEMRIGPNRRSEDGAVIYGLAAHSLG